MAVVKDLFGDAPRRHLGFPSVTVAPDCDVKSSPGPIVNKCDPPTQLSILSESVMDPQALNEVEEGDSSVSYTDNENDQDVSLNFRSGINTDRMFHLLKEENSIVNCQQEVTKQQATVSSSQEVNEFATPTAVSQPLGFTALNATHVVSKIHSRLTDEEQTPEVTYIVQQVLNANLRKQKQISTKVKKKPAAQTPARQKRSNLSTTTTSLAHSDGNKSSLDVLNQMMHAVEHEMEEYERLAGHKVQQAPTSQGVSGFTCSLVNAVCRMMRYLKESERKLQEETLNRQKLEEKLTEHRALIDALTAEVLLAREENFAMQSKLQQYVVVTDEQLISLTHALKGLPSTDTSKRSSPGGFLVRSPEVVQEKPLLNHVDPTTNAFKGEKVLEFSALDLPSKGVVLSSLPDKTRPTPSLLLPTFQPAVLLSPPQQKSSQALPLLQDESIGQQSCIEPKSSVSHRPLVILEDGDRWRSGDAIIQRDGDLVTNKTLQSFPQLDGHPTASTSAVLRQGVGDSAETFTSGVTMNDLQGQVAELRLQNSVVKAQLNKFRHCHQEAGDSFQQPEASQALSNNSIELPKSLDERIAELNRQSSEARNKLLLLMNQQKLAISVSPPISPIPSPPVNLTENGRKTVEVFVPTVETLDSSKGDTSASGISARRSVGVSSQVHLPQSTSLGNVQLTSDSNRIKAEKQREEGWFALSMHLG
ncbi:spindle and centriole-associated protein 1 isoform X2 [Tiliqua scincoides]